MKSVKPIDLLSALDACAGLGPLEILSHPAWGIPVQWNGEAAVLRADAEVPAETLDLSVRLGEESCVLGLVPSATTPELAALFPARDQVPSPILLAVAEKEAGPLFQVLENAFRRELSVQGLAEAPAEGARAFGVAGVPPANDMAGVSPASSPPPALTFTLSLTDTLVRELGDLKNLDCEHPSIAELEVPMEVAYAVFDLSAEEEAGLAPGDYLLLPEMSEEKPGRMCRPGTAPADRLRIVAAEQTNVPFATALQDDLRCAPVGTDDLVLMRGNRRIASGRLSKLGEQPAFAVEALC